MWVEHLFLVAASDQTSAVERVKNFLERYQLVAYEKIEVLPEVYQPDHPLFWPKLEEAIQRNRLFLKDRLKILQEEGFETIMDLKDLPQGYLSKELHVAVHFLDGFFGVDSNFYNLEEDSHWVSRRLVQELKTNPRRFWLISIRGASVSEEPLFERFKKVS